MRVPAPRWGGEQDVRKRQATPFRFDPGEHFVAFMETDYGPVLRARERLAPKGAGTTAARSSSR